MSPFKILGMTMIAIGGIALAQILNKKAEQELKEAVSWVDLLKYITDRISSFAMPISEIISKCDRELLSSCGIDPSDVSGTSFKSLVQHRRCYGKENGKIIQAFAESFGKNEREEQIKECEYYTRLMESRRSTLAEKLPKQKKINLTLCVSSALALIIILI